MSKAAFTPWMTLTLCAMALVLFLSLDDGPAVLETSYYRRFILEGEVWRMITAHLTHYSMRHFVANMLAFAALGIVTEYQIGHVAFARLWLLLAIFISVAMLVCVPDMAVYAGISGINYGLMMFLGIRLLLSCAGKSAAVLFVLLLVSLALVLRQQAVLGTSTFIGELRDIRVAWQAHLAGISAAILFAAQRNDRLRLPWARR